MTSHGGPPQLRHFRDLADLSPATLRHILDHARALKDAVQDKSKGWIYPERPLGDKTLAMIFEKASTRTRVSFEMAMHQLGGSSIMLQGSSMQIGRGESIPDTARTLSRYVDAIMMRTISHDSVTEMAQYASVPVINALTDQFHPCQVMADIQTFEETRGPIKGRTVAWCGDGNNMVSTWIQAAVLLECELRVACPAKYGPAPEVLKWAQERGGRIVVTEDPAKAVDGADCVITDTWISMGDDDTEAKVAALEPYQVNATLMKKAAPDAIFMHCLPAYREQEVSADVIDGPQSVIWDEAENRLHAQKAILLWCFGHGPAK